MTFLLRTLSFSYLRAHPGKALLGIVGVAIGVATVGSVRSAEATLAGSVRATVDRLAGRAHLQITAPGGISEDVLERLHDHPSVESLAPVIEQVAQTKDAAIGALLVVGVDLVGDRFMREYRFGGGDEDVDDPLVFLARPDSVAISRDLARRAGAAIGDPLVIHAAGVERRLIVRALLEPQGFARAYGGNIVITDVYAAQQLFGRGRRFDRIDVRLRDGVPLDDGQRALSGAAGAGLAVETPERRGRRTADVIVAFVGTFNVVSFVALGIALFTIFNLFRMVIHRRRGDIGILRALGATPRQVSLLFVIEGAVLGAVAGAAGTWASSAFADRWFDLMLAALDQWHGLRPWPETSAQGTLLAHGVGIGMCASVAGVSLPAWEAGREPPVRAIATGVFARQTTPLPIRRVAAGLALLALAFAIARLGQGRAMLPLVAVTSAVGAGLIASWAAPWLVRPLAPLLALVAPATGRVAADALISRPRRTAGTAAILTISLAFALGMAEYLESVRGALARWASGVFTSDLIVRSSPGLGPSAVRMPGDWQQRILEHPRVTAVEGIRTESVHFRGSQVRLAAVDAAGFSSRTSQDFAEGDAASFRAGLVERGACAVSDNFARRFRMRVGDSVALESPTGLVHLPIAAVVINFMSDRGTVMIDRSLYVARWQSDRVDAFHVSVARAEEADAVRAELRARFPPEAVPLISTRAEFVREIDRALETLFVVLRAVILLALIVALMGVSTALMLSVAERAREIGVLKALGAGRLQIAGLVVMEGVAIGAVSLLLAIPLGSLLGLFLRLRMAENASGFRFPAVYPADVLTLTGVVLPVVVAIGALLPAWIAARVPPAEVLGHD